MASLTNYVGEIDAGPSAYYFKEHELTIPTALAGLGTPWQTLSVVDFFNSFGTPYGAGLPTSLPSYDGNAFGEQWDYAAGNISLAGTMTSVSFTDTTAPEPGTFGTLGSLVLLAAGLRLRRR